MQLILVLLAALVLAACGGGEEKAEAPPEPSPTETAEPKDEPVACKPDRDGTIDVRARFRKGEKRELTITKRRAQGGSETESISTARLEVLAPRRLRWTAQDVPLPEGAIPPELQAKFEETAEQIVLEYSVDRDGRYVRVENVDEVRAVLERVLDLLREAAGSDEKALEALEASRDTLLSDAFIQASTTQEVAVLHGGYGVRLEEGRPLKTDYTLGNPFGGDPLPAKATVEFAGLDDQGCAEISVDIKPERKAFEQMVREGLSQLRGRSGQKLPKMGLVNTGEYVYDAGSGWMSRAEGLREISADSLERVDHVIVTVRSE